MGGDSGHQAGPCPDSCAVEVHGHDLGLGLGRRRVVVGGDLCPYLVLLYVGRLAWTTTVYLGMVVVGQWVFALACVVPTGRNSTRLIGDRLVRRLGWYTGVVVVSLYTIGQ